MTTDVTGLLTQGFIHHEYDETSQQICSLNSETTG